ncbi:hypothetical protein BKA82DRAFT_4175292, partial [Pisolithus tinctorius]
MLVIFFTLSFFALGSFAGAPSNSSGCLCTYENPCWPTPDQFAELESQVSQPLIYPVPTASACYPANDPSGNCTQVMERWTDGNWRSSIPGSMAEPNFESFVFKNGTISACYLNTSLGAPCEQGSVPVIGVDARTPQDIQACRKLCTAHDYLGRSTGRGAFVVWTHKMKNITYDAEFAPEGAPANETYQAMTVGSGVQWHEAYDVANQNGRMMVGAQDPDGSVGAGGGWFQGGGHSSLSPSYGLGRMLQVSTMWFNSQWSRPLVPISPVNNYQYSDLFWALRGGGGGTYGIVTSVTYRTYQQLPVVLYFMQANVTNATVMKELIGGMLTPPTQSDGRLAANASTQPLTDYWLSLGVQGPFDTCTIGEDGTNMMVTSRLLSRDILTNQYADVAEILSDCQGEVNMVAGGKRGETPSSKPVCGVFWAEGATAEEISGQIDQLKVWIKDMYALTPQAGAYFNEASLFEIDWQYTFFGSHYGKLKEIKDKYDPYRLFVVAEGVGSEEWNEELTCRW